MEPFINADFPVILLSFSLGIIFTLFIVLKFSKEKLKEKISVFKAKMKRFFNNIVSQWAIIVVLIVLYIIFSLFSYKEEMLPEIIGTGLSIFIINFILEEKEYSKKKDLNELLNYKIKKICKISNDMLLKYIDFKEYDSGNISKDLLINIFKKQDLISETIKHYSIEPNGEIKTNQVPKIDYPFFIAKELKPIVMQLTTNYGQYLEYEQIMALIELEEILNKKIFNCRVSFIEGIEETNIDSYLISLAGALDKFNTIIMKLQVRS